MGINKLFAVLLFTFFCGFSVYAEEHPLGSIQGTSVDLKTYDHAFAGVINGVVAWGFVDESNFTSELRFRKYGATIQTTFKRQEGVGLTGELSHIDAQGVQHQTTLTFVGIQPKENKILLKINESTVEVFIQAEDFKNNHFINPTYTTHYNGEEIQFKLIGEACYGYTAHLTMLILGAYIH